MTGVCLCLDVDGWNYLYKLDGVKGGIPPHQLLNDFVVSAKQEWISAKVRDGKKALIEVKRWVSLVNPSQFYVKWPSKVDDDSIRVFYREVKR